MRHTPLYQQRRISQHQRPRPSDRTTSQRPPSAGRGRGPRRLPVPGAVGGGPGVPSAGPGPTEPGPRRTPSLPPGPRRQPSAPRSSFAPSCPSSWQCGPPRPPWLRQVFPAPGLFGTGRRDSSPRALAPGEPSTAGPGLGLPHRPSRRRPLPHRQRQSSSAQAVQALPIDSGWLGRGFAEAPARGAWSPARSVRPRARRAPDLPPDSCESSREARPSSASPPIPSASPAPGSAELPGA